MSENNKTLDYYLETAEKYIQEGKYANARINNSLALSINPLDIEALKQGIRIAEKTGDIDYCSELSKYLLFLTDMESETKERKEYKDDTRNLKLLLKQFADQLTKQQQSKEKKERSTDQIYG